MDIRYLIEQQASSRRHGVTELFNEWQRFEPIQIPDLPMAHMTPAILSRDFARARERGALQLYTSFMKAAERYRAPQALLAAFNLLKNAAFLDVQPSPQLLDFISAELAKWARGVGDSGQPSAAAMQLIERLKLINNGIYRENERNELIALLDGVTDGKLRAEIAARRRAIRQRTFIPFQWIVELREDLARMAGR
jgi:hypothetical protein